MNTTPPLSPSPYPRPNLDQATGPACPKCGSQATKAMKYTWWGGVLGPRMFNLAKCSQCKCQFNSKTGKDALTAIILYNVVGFLIGLGVILALQMSR
jgi:hypothetical protein